MLINIKLNKDLIAELSEKSEDGSINHFRGENLISFGNCDIWNIKGNFFSESGFSSFYGDGKFNLKNIWLINRCDNTVIDMKQISSHQTDEKGNEYEIIFCRNHKNVTIQDELGLICKYDSKRGNYRVAICDKRRGLGFASMNNWYIRFEFEMNDGEPAFDTKNETVTDDNQSHTDIITEYTKKLYKEPIGLDGPRSLFFQSLAVLEQDITSIVTNGGTIRTPKLNIYIKLLQTMFGEAKLWNNNQKKLARNMLIGDEDRSSKNQFSNIILRLHTSFINTDTHSIDHLTEKQTQVVKLLVDIMVILEISNPIMEELADKCGIRDLQIMKDRVKLNQKEIDEAL